MTTASAVPVTREEELEGDEALETLRRTGRRRLALDAVARFRAADGFSHSRALAFQATLTLLPALIASSAWPPRWTRRASRRSCATRSARSRRAPRARSSPTRCARARARRARSPARPALAGGAIAAALAGTTAMAQVERGANRIYGTESDRPFLRKYLTAAALAATAGTLALLSLVVLVGGSAIRDAVGWGDTLDDIWRVARWPLGIAMAVASVALLLEHAPRRRQPEPSWLAFGALTPRCCGSASWPSSRSTSRRRTASARPTGRWPGRSASCCGPS
jgi:uncharacterized BrkB/YihY/UPF0761 family membrane protein